MLLFLLLFLLLVQLEPNQNFRTNRVSFLVLYCPLKGNSTKPKTTTPIFGSDSGRGKAPANETKAGLGGGWIGLARLLLVQNHGDRTNRVRREGRQSVGLLPTAECRNRSRRTEEPESKSEIRRPDAFAGRSGRGSRQRPRGRYAAFWPACWRCRRPIRSEPRRLSGATVGSSGAFPSTSSGATPGSSGASPGTYSGAKTCHSGATE